MVLKQGIAPLGRTLVAMVTPFAKDGSVDYDTAQRLACHIIDGGSDGIIVNGTTGESPTTTPQEKASLVSCVVEAVGDRAVLVANIGSNNTADSVVNAAAASKLGVDGVMAVIPYYNKPPQEGMKAHFTAIAHATELPVILYNIPGRCSVNMTAETTLALAHEVENIAAVKEASGNLDQVQEILASAPSGFSVFSGDDSLTYDIMKMGGTGVISTLGNIAPDRMKTLVELCALGDFDGAAAQHSALSKLMKGLFVTANPILVKAGLQEIGIDVGSVRLPLIPATDKQRKDLRELLIEANVL